MIKVLKIDQKDFFFDDADNENEHFSSAKGHNQVQLNQQCFRISLEMSTP